MVIHNVAGNNDAFNALIYKTPDSGVINYINQHMQKASDIIGSVSSNFMEQTKALYDSFNSSAVISRAKSILTSAGGSMSDNSIYPLNFDNIHTANYIMQQYIIANPTINSMVNEDLIYGFQDTYFNPEPEVYGKDRNDYRRVMNGVIQYDKDVAYMERYVNSDEVDDLHPIEQFNILDTWDVANYALSKGIDITSPDRDEI